MHAFSTLRRQGMMLKAALILFIVIHYPTSMVAYCPEVLSDINSSPLVERATWLGIWLQSMFTNPTNVILGKYLKVILWVAQKSPLWHTGSIPSFPFFYNNVMTEWQQWSMPTGAISVRMILKVIHMDVDLEWMEFLLKMSLHLMPWSYEIIYSGM